MNVEFLCAFLAMDDEAATVAEVALAAVRTLDATTDAMDCSQVEDEIVLHSHQYVAERTRKHLQPQTTKTLPHFVSTVFSLSLE